MAAESVVFLPIGKVFSNNATVRRSQWPMVQKGFFSKRACIPAAHAGGFNCHPIDAADFAGHVSADFLEALPSKDLALSGNICLSFETVVSRVVPGRLPEHS